MYKKNQSVYNIYSYTEAQRTIPLDSIPLILAGFKLHNTTTDLSCISSIGTNFTRPLTIVLRCSSPINI